MVGPSGNWPRSTVGVVFKVVGGGTPATSRQEYWVGSIPWVSSADIGDHGTLSPRRHISESAVANSATNIVPSGSLIVATRVGLGKIGLAQHPTAFSQDCHGLIVDPSLVVPAYAMLQLRSRVRRFSLISRGTTIAGVTKGQLLSVPFDLPPISEQQRIADEIEKQESVLDAGQVGLERGQLGLDRYLAACLDAAYRHRLSLQDVVTATEWPIVPLGDLLSEPLRNGHSAKRAQDGLVRTLTLTAVTRGDFSEANTKLTDADPRKVANLWLRPGDILIERSNTPQLVGTARMYRGPENFAIFPDLLIRVRLLTDISPEFVELMIRAPASRSYFQARAQGIAGSMPKIDQETVAKLPIPLPSRPVQDAVVSAWHEISSSAGRLTTEIANGLRRAAILRHLMYRSAFTGDLL